MIGTLLQLGVLTYSGFAAYYPTLMLPKNEVPIVGYAFPCNAIGTLILVTGMLICSHVVESSTEEKRYGTKQGRVARMVWLQKTQIVSDQSFGSFAIFPKMARTLITTSQRPYRQGSKTHGNSLEKEGGPLYILKVKAVFSTMVSLCGFVLQFVGLRGMHWSASIAQLGATLVMAISDRGSVVGSLNVRCRSLYLLDLNLIGLR